MITKLKWFRSHYPFRLVKTNQPVLRSKYLKLRGLLELIPSILPMAALPWTRYSVALVHCFHYNFQSTSTAKTFAHCTLEHCFTKTHFTIIVIHSSTNKIQEK